MMSICPINPCWERLKLSDFIFTASDLFMASLNNRNVFTSNSRGFMYSTHVGKYSLVSRSTGIKAVYLLWILQALLVWTA